MLIEEFKTQCCAYVLEIVQQEKKCFITQLLTGYQAIGQMWKFHHNFITLQSG